MPAPDHLTCAVVVCSDSVAAGKNPDASTQAVAGRLAKHNVAVTQQEVIPDDFDMIQSKVRHFSAAGFNLLLFVGAFLFMVPAVILSGFATPIENMPPFVQALTTVDPLRYFLVILRKVFLEGAGFELLADQFWPMALIGAVSLSLAGWLFRHRMN